MKASDLFQKLASSHYGYDGGNLDADIWFSGLEWGGGISPQELREDLETLGDKAPSCEDPEERKKYLSYQFDRKLLKILATSLGYSISDYKKMLETEKPYASDGPIFKLNLYPISFRNTDSSHWAEEFFALTGFPTKELYMAWVQQNRFGFFNGLVLKHRPKVVVCCGTTYKADFLLAFGGLDSIFEGRVDKLELNGKSDVEVYNSHVNPDTKIVITPFFGNRYGLTSNEECEKVGKLICKYL